MTHHRSQRLVFLILTGALLAVPSWGASGKSSAADLRQISSLRGPVLEAFGDPLNPHAGCEMDPNGVLHC